MAPGEGGSSFAAIGRRIEDRLKTRPTSSGTALTCKGWHGAPNTRYFVTIFNYGQELFARRDRYRLPWASTVRDESALHIVRLIARVASLRRQQRKDGVVWGSVLDVIEIAQPSQPGT